MRDALMISSLFAGEIFRPECHKRDSCGHYLM